MRLYVCCNYFLENQFQWNLWRKGLAELVGYTISVPYVSDSRWSLLARNLADHRSSGSATSMPSRMKLSSWQRTGLQRLSSFSSWIQVRTAGFTYALPSPRSQKESSKSFRSGRLG